MNSKYELIMYWSEEDNTFVVEVPELPGCMADGPTQNEALLNAQIVIDQWIETAEALGREISKPKGKLMFA
ncbi:type II toxin-antitoxin system HicB family antitoxin [Dyadobacter psychrophilus]|uniref:Predicted nuclease of the RNAse H fold, HicB family n=1 Tax=Dyadobacter psychrophilus TaxID=651661 RepID=A0A1T5FBV1_9BACT|nr:type II toxin-antitoxin system HicB family antitoxin [Dyadobacter psychrophilus]SKB93641.1 Predicted nuclease of the RNAse H fold, HicB family [Dyadobacter psychrophilus]